MKKSLIFNIAVILLAIATITVGVLLIFKSSADTLISVGDAKGLTGDIVEVPVTIKNNPGLWGGQIIIDYDSSNLSFVSIANGTVFDTCESNNTGNSIAMVVYNAASQAELKNTKENGTVATIKFKIKASAKKDTHDIIVASETNFCNAKEELVEVAFDDGTIKVN